MREIQEALPEDDRPAYTMVQTMIYRLEEKGVVKRVKKVGNAHIFEATLTRKAIHKRLISDLLDSLRCLPIPANVPPGRNRQVKSGDLLCI